MYVAVSELSKCCLPNFRFLVTQAVFEGLFFGSSGWRANAWLTASAHQMLVDPKNGGQEQKKG